ncbi:MAG: hypothetical protein ACOCTK_01980 [Candidatus Saliniplasma sp.]
MMSGRRRGILILLLLVIMLTSFSLASTQPADKYTLSINGLETKDNYLGLSYIQIISKSNDTVIYEGYVLNRTMVIEEKYQDGYVRKWEVNDTIHLSFHDTKRRTTPLIEISKDADFTFGKCIDSGRDEYGEDIKKLVPARWNLSEDAYIIKGEGYTDEDEEKYDEIDKEYPDFTDRKEIELNSDKDVTLFFEREEDLPRWAGFYIFSKENISLVLILIHLIPSVISLTYFQHKFSKEDDEGNHDLYISHLRRLYISSILPVIILFVLLFYTFFSFNPRFWYFRDVQLFYSYCIFFFIISGLFIGKIYVEAKSIEDEKRKILKRLSVVYMFSLVFVVLVSFPTITKDMPSCYVRPIETWTPEIPKKMLLLPLIVQWYRKKKLRKELKEEGIYREEWDDI